MIAAEVVAGGRPDVIGAVLAGGRALRMGGGDKCLLPLGEQTLLEAVIGRARPQVASLLLLANGDAGRFARFGLPVVDDAITGFAGPLAGILAGLGWTDTHASHAPWVASFAADTPFLPLDYVDRSLAAVAREGADLACATSHGRAHPVFGLWPVRLTAALRQALVDEGVRKIDAWTGRYRVAFVDFTDAAGVDPFFNVNTPDDLAEAAGLAARLAAAAPGRSRGVP